MTVAGVVSGLTALDHALMRRVHRWRPPRWLRWYLVAATRGGDGWLWWLCGALILASHQDSGYRAIATGALAAAFGILLFRLLKTTVKRKRPCQIEPHCWYDLLPPDQFSFPSGHSLTAFAVATSLGQFYPFALPTLLLCAASIAISRVLLGMHFLTDVIAGALFGALVGYASAYLTL
jgi:undecaprenyl-diphosphatase